MSSTIGNASKAIVKTTLNVNMWEKLKEILKKDYQNTEIIQNETWPQNRLVAILQKVATIYPSQD